MSDTIKALNLYAGIGGNRKLWENVDVTAVEINPKIARFYSEQFPDDEVVVADAHDFLERHYDAGWDFIWTSPPCQTHSKVSRMAWASDAKQNRDRDPVYPDMRLYQEIIFLNHFADCDWVVENVEPYYRTPVEPQRVGRHCLWSNVTIPPFESDAPAAWTNPPRSEWEEHLGFDVTDADLGHRKDQILHNCVDPELGKHVFDAVFHNRQESVHDYLGG